MWCSRVFANEMHRSGTSFQMGAHLSHTRGGESGPLGGGCAGVTRSGVDSGFYYHFIQFPPKFLGFL